MLAYDSDSLNSVTLPSGSSLGPYEIVSLLGAGGMGEEYRARDTKLSRDVALNAPSRAVAAAAERPVP